MKLKRRNSNKKLLLVGFGVFGITCTLYILLLTQSPKMPFIVQTNAASSESSVDVDSIKISKIGVNIPIYSGDQSVLEKGAWHRYPERGDPEKGGNFILSAHRFNLGFTPQRTKARSPFYNIHKLSIGDVIEITYGGKAYTYKVDKLYDVDKFAVEIELPSEKPKLTIYSCALGGEKDGRIVVEAKPVD